MIESIAAAQALSALAGLNAEMTGLSLEQTWNKQGMKDEGIGFGWQNKTTTTPAITGNTSGSISTSQQADPVDAWHEYQQNFPPVSEVSGGLVEGSTSVTYVYSLLQKADQSIEGVIPIGVPIQQSYVAISLALGVSMDAAQMDVETKQRFANSIVSGGNLVYDSAKNLAKAWWDGVHILFPKSTVDAVNDVIIELGIGSTSGNKNVYFEDIPSVIYSGEGVGSGTSSSTAISGTTIYVSTLGAYVKLGSVTAYKYFKTGAKKICIASDSSFGRQLYGYNDNGVFIQSIQLSSVLRYTYDGKTVYYGTVSYGDGETNAPDNGTIANVQEAAWVAIYGSEIPGGYPDGTEQSEATSYTPSTIPSAGGIATSDSTTEPVVPINLPANPDNTFDSPDDPVATPTNPDQVDDLPMPPIPMPIPDTNASNPDVPLVDSSVINSTLINELVEELANTLDPQPGQSSGIIPFPPMPGIPNIDPDTGLPDGTTSYPSIVPASGSGLIHVYNPTPGEMASFGNWLWVTYADATIEKIWNNPFDGIIGAHELYATPQVDGRDNIRSGFLTCPTSADLVRQRYTEIDCGTIIVPEFYGNYLDYSPYSQAYIYLPFIGINEVSIDDIVGHAINLRYRVDAYTGSCVAMVWVAKNGYRNLCYQWAGNCAVEVPLAGGSQAAIKAGMMQAEAYARAAMVSAGGHLLGGIGSALMGSLGGALSSVAGIAGDYANAKAGVEAARVANKSSVQHSGQFGASHGAMGQKIPFIIIRNPIQVKVVNYNDDYGYPAHKRVIIGGCTGYLRVREVNVISAHATDDEKAAIEALLKNGVYVS